jgi:hypothetical protein
VVLLLANAVPLAGVLFWGWSVSSVVILYWFENIVIGLVNVARMITFTPSNGAIMTALAGAGETRAAEVNQAMSQAMSQAMGQLGGTRIIHGFKLFLIPFFILHYFGFCAGHGVFVFSMFGDADGYFGESSGIDLLGTLGRAIEIFWTPLGLAAAVLLLSHVFSFVQNYLIGGEYRRMDLKRLMVMPYGRIIALHITIIAGGFVTMMLGEPVWLVLILVAVKTAVDLKMHLKEHRRANSLPG